MSPAGTCRKCGSPLPEDAVAAQCASCLIDLALSPTDDLPFDISHRRFGGYALGRLLGAGGMGVVYEASRLTDGAKVALKVIRDAHVAAPSALCRFTIETEAAARLDHPNIVRIHEAGESNGHPFFCMDLIDGESLSVLLAQRKYTLSQKDTALLIAKIARAVHHAHLRGVLHRDIKPGNILIDRSGEPRLTDFGLAKLSGECAPLSLTGSGDAPGTPSYMSPEQAQGKEIGCGADVYGLGAVLYALLTGRAPFEGQTHFETFKRVVDEPVLPPRRLNPSVARELEIICLKCLDKDPRRRYATAEALANDLENFAACRPIEGRGAGMTYRTVQWVKRNPVGSGLIGSLCVGLLIALALLKVVDDQRQQIRLDRDLAFDDGMEKISQLWRDPHTDSVVISARELHILAGRSPLDSRRARYQLTFAVTGNDRPSSIAQRYARVLANLAGEMERELHDAVSFNLRLFKRFDDEGQILSRPDVDVSLVSGVGLLRAQQRSSGIAPIALAGDAREVVVFTSTNSAVQDLGGLRGLRILLPAANETVTALTKARLSEAGLKASDLTLSAMEARADPTQVFGRVLRGEVHAGVAQRQLFERYKHLGLDEIAHFKDSPHVVAVRMGVPEQVTKALQRALQSSGPNGAWGEHKFIVNSGAIQSELEQLRNAIHRADQLEGTPIAKEKL